MPKPDKPWIAIDFNVAVTQVSLTLNDTVEPVDESFPNVFLFDEETKEIQACVDLDELDEDLAKDVFVLSADDIKPNATISPPNSTVEIPIVKVLAALLTHVRKKCQEKYYKNARVNACQIVCSSKIASDSKIPPDAILKAAAAEAGFNDKEIEIRRRSSAIVQALAREKNLRDLVVLCDASYGSLSLALFERKGDGYALYSAKWNNRRAHLGVEYVAGKTAKHIVAAGMQHDVQLSRFRVPIAFKVLMKLREGPPSSSKFFIKWGEKFECSRTLAERSKKYVGEIQGIFDQFFKGLKETLNGRAFEIVVVGPGSYLPGLKKALNDSAPSPADFSVLGDCNAAKAWVELLRAMDTLPQHPSKEQKTFNQIYRSAKKGDSDDQYKLAKLLARGAGCPFCPEEAFYWMKRAAKDEHPKAYYRIAKCYEEGLGVLQDDEEAQGAYKKAAELGVPKAQYKLALRYRDEGNDKLWRHWCAVAAASGYKDAIRAANIDKINYASMDVEDEINLDPAVLNTGQRDWEWLETLVGVLLAALVFFLGAVHMRVYNHGPSQTTAMIAASGVCGVLALTMVVIGSGYSFYKLFNTKES